jgi:hypothetical protein
LPAASVAFAVTVNGTLTDTHPGTATATFANGPSTSNRALWPVTPLPVTVILSRWKGAAISVVVVVLTPWTKSAGAAGVSTPSRLDQLAGPL